MLKATTTDISLIKSYIPKVSKIPGISPTIAQFYKPIENRNIHEGRVVGIKPTTHPTISSVFFINIAQLSLSNQRTDWIQHEFITLTLAQFGQILKIPYNGQARPYCTDLPTPEDNRRLLELERVVVDRTIKSQTATLNQNQILTKELSPDMKQWEELIRENVFGLGGHRDRLPACLAHMLYYVFAEEQYNLAYFFVKRIECARATPTANLPYGMFLTRVMEMYPHLDNGIYDIVKRARHSVSSSSFHHQGTSSHQQDDDDDDDVKTSRASTPSPITYLNSFNLLDYHNYQMPSSSEQTDETLFARQTTLINQMQQIHKEMRGGFKSFGKALKGVFSKKKK
ncbi:hypothetical protein Tco_0498777 [Tanacetum coccineum]